eukprot:m.103332 g.103332  ORF g.103332 m.103332 type:complete len:1236 (+) comp13806_c0_seq1:127-3834(+)
MSDQEDMNGGEPFSKEDDLQSIDGDDNHQQQAPLPNEAAPVIVETEDSSDGKQISLSPEEELPGTETQASAPPTGLRRPIPAWKREKLLRERESGSTGLKTRAGSRLAMNLSPSLGEFSMNGSTESLLAGTAGSKLAGRQSTGADKLGGSPSEEKSVLMEMKNAVTELYKREAATWLNALFKIDISEENILEKLSDGVLLCQLADKVRKGEIEWRGMKKPSSPVEDEKPIPKAPKALNPRGHKAIARDNCHKFIQWCKRMGLPEEVLFESEDLVGSTERASSVLTCLLDVARVSRGIEVPPLVQRERDMDEAERALLDNELAREEYERQQALQRIKQAELERQQRLKEEEEKRKAEEERKLEEERLRIEEEKRRAEEERKRLEEEKRRAEEAERQAEETRRKAEEARRAAEEAEAEHQRALEEAERQRQEALEMQRKKDEEERLRLEEERRKAEEERKRREEELQEQLRLERQRAEEERRRLEEELEREKERIRKLKEEAEKAEQERLAAEEEAKRRQEEEARRQAILEEAERKRQAAIKKAEEIDKKRLEELAAQEEFLRTAQAEFQKKMEETAAAERDITDKILNMRNQVAARRDELQKERERTEAAANKFQEAAEAARLKAEEEMEKKQKIHEAAMAALRAIEVDEDAKRKELQRSEAEYAELLNAHAEKLKEEREEMERSMREQLEQRAAEARKAEEEAELIRKRREEKERLLAESKRNKDELDAEVQKLMAKVETTVQLVRLRSGTYLIAGTTKKIFVRILNSIIMVRVGGGWQNLESWLRSHKPALSEKSKSIAKQKLDGRHKQPASFQEATLQVKSPDREVKTTKPSKLPMPKQRKSMSPQKAAGKSSGNTNVLLVGGNGESPGRILKEHETKKKDFSKAQSELNAHAQLVASLRQEEEELLKRSMDSGTEDMELLSQIKERLETCVSEFKLEEKEFESKIQLKQFEFEEAAMKHQENKMMYEAQIKAAEEAGQRAKEDEEHALEQRRFLHDELQAHIESYEADMRTIETNSLKALEAKQKEYEESRERLKKEQDAWELSQKMDFERRLKALEEEKKAILQRTNSLDGMVTQSVDRNEPVLSFETGAGESNIDELNGDDVPSAEAEQEELPHAEQEDELPDVKSPKANEKSLKPVGQSDETSVENLTVGAIVLTRIGKGILQWVGKADFLNTGQLQDWCGVKMDEYDPSCNNGCYEGVKYFDCPDGRGLFCQPKQIKKIFGKHRSDDL